VLGGNRFRKAMAGVGFIKQRLPLQIGRFNEVSIDDVERTDSGTNQEVGGGGPDGPTADNRRAGAEQTALPVGSNPGEQHLAGVFFLEKIARQGSGPGLANQTGLPSNIIAPKCRGEATPLCYASSERRKA